ncbi:MAG: HEAT repeat domain-containing protein [Cyanobacteria bacterium P01_D01_bin.156]
MAISAGIGVLIGMGIGAGITAFFMQRIIRRQDNALQQSLNRLNRVQEDHAQELSAALGKMEADYEQKLASKIERYQNTHQEQLADLEAEYEARIAALGNFAPDTEDNSDTPTPEDNRIPPADITPAEAPSPTASFSQIPDPWTDEAIAAPAAVEPVIAENPTLHPPATASGAASSTSQKRPPSASSASAVMVSRATELGKAAAINPKEAIRTIPQLGKLLKNNDADVRLAAITALQESGSIKALPFFRQALRDTDSRVVAAANAGLSRFKGAKKAPKKVKKTSKKGRR